MRSDRPSLNPIVLSGTFLLIAGAALSLRLGVALREPLWLDELHTAWCVDGPFNIVWNRAGQGNQSPFYFWIEWLVCQPFGLTEFWLRLPSVVYGSLAAIAASLFVWSFKRSLLAASLTGLLVAIDPQFIFYGSEARPYALVQLLSVLQVFLFARETRVQTFSATADSNSPINPGLAVFTALLLMTHLTAGSLIIAEVFLLLIFFRQIPIRRAAISLALGSTAFLPLAFLTQRIFSHRTDWQAVSDSAQLIAELQPAILVYVVAPLIVCLPAWGWQRFRVEPNIAPENRLLPWMTLTLTWGLTPIILLWAADLSGLAPVAMNRYAQAGAIAWPVFCGLLLSSISSPSLKAIAVTLIGLNAIVFSGLPNPLLNNRKPAVYRAENWSAAVELINSEIAGGTVFLFSNLLEDHHSLLVQDSGRLQPNPRHRNYLAFPVSGIYKIRPEVKVFPRPTRRAGRFTNDDLQTVRDQSEAWFLIRGTPELVNAITREFEKRLSLPPSQTLNWDVRELPGSVVYVVKSTITTTPTIAREPYHD